MKILVTGGSGVIGFSLTEYLAKLYPGSTIYSTFHRNPSSLITLSKLSSAPSRIIPISYADIFSQASLRFDQIWHFATYGQPARFIENWKEVIQLNSTDIISLSPMLSEGGKFIFASTSELYGSQLDATESSIPLSLPEGPRSIYTESKRLGESICTKLFAKENHYIFRICLAYSNKFNLDDRRVLYELIVKAFVDRSITMLDSGDALRQYIFIDDAIKMMTLLVSSTNLGNFSNSVYNICNPEPVTIRELAEMIGAYLQVPVYPGPNCNPHAALSRVSVIPYRFTHLYPNFTFTPLSTGLKSAIDAASKSFPDLSPL